MNVQIRILAANARAQMMALNAQLNGLSTGFGGAAKSAGIFGAAIGGLRLEALGSRVQWIGRQLEYNFTLPILAAAGASAKLALDNEKAFTRVTKVYGDAAHGAQFYANEIKALEKTFVQLSNTFGVSQADTINIAADWAAAGASGLALAKSVRLTMQTMILGEMGATEATQALIAIQAQYGFSVDDLTKTIAILNMTENQTGISLTGLVEGFSRAAGVARASGVDVRHLAAMLAALTPAAGSAAQAGNALKTIFSRLASPTKETTEVLGLMHIHMTDLAWKSASMTDQLGMLSTAFEKLSSKQKEVVSSTVASRWQINKFEILMNDLANPMGYYAKSLAATADSQAIFTQMTRELNTVLDSNPQKLKIIWTLLQNGAANIIQPLIPMMLYLASTISNVVQWFSNLNPGVQKLIIGFLLLLAALGPITRIFGATGILIATIGKVVGFALVPLLKFGGALKWLISVPINAFLTTMGVALRGFIIMMGPVFAAGLQAMGFVSAAGWIVLRGIWMAGAAAVVQVQKLAASALFTVWRAMGVAIGAFTGSLWYKVIVPLWATGFAAVRAVTVGGWALVMATWRGALVVMSLWTFFTWQRIVAITTAFFTTGLLPLLRVIGGAILAAFTGPWGVAILIVVGLVAIFWKQLKAIFSAMIKGIVQGFNALPQAIQNALMAVVRTIRAAVMQAYKLMSYLNPWARHSPSLIDNVTTGVAEIIRQFNTLSNVGSIFQRAGANLGKFGQALSNIRKLMQQASVDKVRQDLVDWAPAMLGDFDQVAKVLKSLQTELGNVGATLPVERLKEMSDAIFANDQEQKRLRLSMMQMENAIGPLDQLQTRLDQINGAIELMGGEQKNLRDKGAGSEILSQYDNQLSALQDQKTAINQQIAPLLELSKQIDALSRAGEQLNLEQSLALDPITRQMDELGAAINAVEQAMNDMGAAAQAAQAAASAGGGLTPGAQNFIDAAGGNFPDPGGMAQIGREGSLADQSAAIDDFTKQLADQTSGMFGAFSFLDPIKKAWNTSVKWLKDNIGPGIKGFWDGFTGALSGLPNPFGGIDFSGVLRILKEAGSFIIGIFKDIWTLIAPPLKEIGKIFKEAFLTAMQKIGPELAKFKDLLGPIQKLFAEIWPVVKVVAAIIGGILLLAISILANVIVNVLVPVLNWIIDLIAGVIKILRGVIEFIVGVFTGDWDLAWQGIKDIFGGIWDIIFSTIKNVLGLIWGVIKGIGEGIASFWNLLWTKIGDWVKNTWNSILGVIKDIGNGIWGFISGIGTTIRDFINARIKDFLDFVVFIQSLPGKIAKAASGLWDGFINGFKSMMNTIIKWWNNLEFSIGPISMFGLTFGPYKISTPNYPMLAQGGMVADRATAIVGEGRQGYPEYVIPTDPMYRGNAMKLFGQLADALGITNEINRAMSSPNLASVVSGVDARKIQRLAKGGKLGGGASNALRGGGVTLTADIDNRRIVFNGNLEFPNVHDGNDAEDFIRNLEALISEV